MATKKPRLTITMDEDVYATVREFVEVTNGSISGLISDCLRAALPQLQLVSSAVRKMKEGDAQLNVEAVDRLERELKQIEKIGQLAADQMDIFVDGWFKKP